jgi:hypothetical protein
MIDDILKVYIEETNYVRIPKPIEGIAPIECMRFIAPSSTCPPSLTLPVKRSGSVYTSRRSIAMNISVPSAPSSHHSMDSHRARVELNDMLGVDEDMDDSNSMAYNDVDSVSIQDEMVGTESVQNNDDANAEEPEVPVATKPVRITRRRQL